MTPPSEWSTAELKHFLTTSELAGQVVDELCRRERAASVAPSLSDRRQLMNALGHTPGPWEYVYRPQHGYPYTHTVMAGDGEHKQVVARLDGYSRHQPSPGDEVVAVNGRLLAAAPDLFQAVQDLRVLVERIASDEEMAGEAGTVLFRVEEAVRKATVPPDGVICHGEAI